MAPRSKFLAEFDSAHIASNPVLVPTATAYKSKKKDDPDSPGWWESTTGSESEQFLIATDKEIKDLVKRSTWPHQHPTTTTMF